MWPFKPKSKPTNMVWKNLPSDVETKPQSGKSMVWKNLPTSASKDTAEEVVKAAAAALAAAQGK